MKRAVLISGVTVAAIALTSSFAMAKGGHHGHRGGEPMTFEQLDTNGDGMVTLAELQARGEARFNETDTDGNGSLSAEEMKAKSERATDERIAKMIEKRDENGDGELSLDEVKPDGDRAEKMFERLDEDGDGNISQAEFDAMKDKRKGGKRHGGKDRDEK